MNVLGIDVAKDKLDVHLLHQDAHHIAQFNNDKSGWTSLRNWLNKRVKKAPLHVCLEATGRYGEGVTEFLHAKGYTVSVVNPARIKAYSQVLGSRNKTDLTDAAIIADFCSTQRDSLPIWAPPDPAQRRLQALFRHLEDLEKNRQQQQNRLSSGKQDKQVERNLKQLIQFLDKQIDQVKDDIDDHIDQNPDLKKKRDLIASIKGIGKPSASRLLAEIPNIDDFDSPKQLVAFAGLNPKQRQSGSSIRGKTHISKIGNSRIRALLYMPALTTKNKNYLLQPFVQRMQLAGHPPQSIVVAVMRKLLHLIFGILKSGQPYDPQYLQKQQICA